MVTIDTTRTWPHRKEGNPSPLGSANGSKRASMYNYIFNCVVHNTVHVHGVDGYNMHLGLAVLGLLHGKIAK